MPTAGTTSLNFQVAIHSDGSFEYRYQNMTAAATDTVLFIVGFSKGNLNVSGGPTSVDLGPRDLSAGAFVTTGPDRRPPALDGTQPRLDFNWTLNTTNADAISPIAITFVGSATIPSGIDLGFLGAPDCRGYLANILGQLTGAVATGSASVAIPIPNHPTLLSVPLAAQSVCLTIDNSLGLKTSNALEGTIGL